MNQLEKMHKILDTIYNKYEYNEYIITKLNNIFDNLEKTLEDSYNSNLQRIAKNEELSKEQITFIQYFLNKNLYFYLQYESKYFMYDNTNYYLYNYNDLLIDIYSNINENNNDNLLKNKYSIQNKLIKEIKTKSILRTIPNSSTIQNTLKLFYPNIFQNKDTAKYFLLILGDSILKKQTNNQFIISNSCKKFIDEISIHIQDCIGIHDVLNCIKYKYIEDNYEYNRFIYINIIDSISEIKIYFINIIVVACYYSNRYKSSEMFLNNYCNNITKDKIMSLSKPIDNIVNDFCNEMFQYNDNEQININSTNFLWELFIEKYKYPYIINEKQMQNKIHNKYNVINSNIISVNNTLLKEVFCFIEFVKSNFQPSTENEQFEIDEIIQIYIDNVENSNYENNLSNYIASKSIKYYLKNIKIYENKFFILKCKYWNKLYDVKSFINNYKNNNEICTFYDAYDLYSNSKEYKYIANKYYFEYVYEDV